MESPLFSLAEVPGKGLGMIATSNIRKGTLIVSEPPLFILPDIDLDPDLKDPDACHNMHVAIHLLKLNDAQQKAFLGLARSIRSDHVYLDIFSTNSIPVGADGAIFPTISRFNHSCSSNAGYTWHKGKGEEKIFAHKDISKGEEIVVGYLEPKSWAKSKADRQADLLRLFNFTCACQACSQTGDDLLASDARRTKFGQLLSTNRILRLALAEPGLALQDCREMLRLLKEEGESDLKAYSVLECAWLVSVTHGDLARGRAFANLAMARAIFCKGSDYSSRNLDMEKAEAPERYALACVSKLWTSAAEDAPKRTQKGFEEWLWARAVCSVENHEEIRGVAHWNV